MAFDTLDINADIAAQTGNAFSGGNLTVQSATASSIVDAAIAQALEGKSSGKWYVEWSCVAVSGNTDGVGVVSSSGVYSTFMGGAPVAGDAGWGYYTNSHVANGGSAIAVASTYGAGDVIGLAIDLDHGTLWFRLNTGSWIGSTGSPDPATNTGGFDISPMLTHGLLVYPAVNLSGTSAIFTANFGASSFLGAAPSGFTSGWTSTLASTGWFGSFASTSRNGSANIQVINGDCLLSPYTADRGGNLSKFQACFVIAGGSASPIYGVVYDSDGSGGLPGTLLGTSTNSAASTPTGAQLAEFNFSGLTLSNGHKYWFGFVNGGSGASNIPGPGIAASIKYHSTATLGVPDATFSGSPSSVDFRYPLRIFVAGTSATGSGAINTENETAPAGSGLIPNNTGSGDIGTETETAPGGQGASSKTGQGSIGTENETAPTGNAALGAKGQGDIGSETETAPGAEAIGGDSVLRTTQVTLKTLGTDQENARTTQTVLKVLFTEAPQTGPEALQNVYCQTIISLQPSLDGALEEAFPSPWL